MEKSDRLGGVLRGEEEVTFKKNLDAYLNQQEQRIHDANIEVRLNTAATPELAETINPDIIAAMGAEPVKPAIPDIDNANVICAQDAYTAIESIGDEAVIIGAGLVGVELGLHLIANGKKVKIVELSDRVNDGGNFLHMLGLEFEVIKRGLDIQFNTRVKEVRENGVLCEINGTEQLVAVDTVIYAVGQKPCRDDALALNFAAPEFYLVGDVIAPRDITSANAEAFMTARNIGRF